MNKQTKEKINKLWDRFKETSDPEKERIIRRELHIILYNSVDVSPEVHRVFLMGRF